MKNNNFKISKILLPIMGAFWISVFSQGVFETSYDQRAVQFLSYPTFWIFFIFLFEFSLVLGNIIYDNRDKEVNISNLSNTIKTFGKSEGFDRFSYSFFTFVFFWIILYLWVKITK